MKPLLIKVIPSALNSYCVCDLDDAKMIAIGDLIIAWRIEIHEMHNSDEVFSRCMPITVDGDAVSNCIGVMHHDGTVTVFEECVYNSIIELQQHRYPPKD